MPGLGDPQKLVTKLGYSLSKRSDQLLWKLQGCFRELEVKQEAFLSSFQI